jgi:DNA helicase-2/ATP-dependent DNA helicase PcrA
MTGVEHGIFPREDKTGDDLEEERRLFYVGATRAMDELYICSCKKRRMYGRLMDMEPSLFLREINRKSLRIIGNSQQPASNRQQVTDEYWKRGDGVYHDDFGYGGVVNIQNSDDGPLITVRFNTGFETKFSSLNQSGAYTKIKE